MAPKDSPQGSFELRAAQLYVKQHQLLCKPSLSMEMPRKVAVAQSEKHLPFSNSKI